jgi:VIT1/CCC1 family predicted Fe2+/Mn2+ transporter
MSLVTTIKTCKNEDDAIPIIDKNNGSKTIDNLNAEEQKRMFSAIYKMLVKTELRKVHLTKDDIIGAFVCFIIVFTTGFLTIIPFFLPANLHIKIWISRFISLGMLFGVGYIYAKYTNRSEIKTAIRMVIIGFLIYVIIILLGG